MPVTSKKRARGKQYAGPVKKKYKTGGIQAAVAQAVKSRFHKMVESKRAVHTSNDGLEVFHNNFITMDGNLLETTHVNCASVGGGTAESKRYLHTGLQRTAEGGH